MNIQLNDRLKQLINQSEIVLFMKGDKYVPQCGFSAKGLKIKLAIGCCSGFKYEYNYADEAEKSEKTYKLSAKLSIFMDDFTFDRSYGSVIDFTISLHSSGMQIINPRKKRACSCGTSISF